ncbi:MAG TPA: phosphosulfolactate synthase, partial [Actinomycetota bacterium]
HVLDKGSPVPDVEALLSVAAGSIDLWKLGWGTAYLDPGLEAKLPLLARHDVRACVGGTLLEAAWLQGRATECLDWAAETKFPCVEVSNGAVGMPIEEKHRLIAEASDRFVVVSEVGSKDPEATVSPAAWAEEVAADLEAGAEWVLTEGRESGTVGLYTPRGEVREDVVEAVTRVAGPARLIFEAPRKSQQAWLIRRFGPDVNLGNVRLDEVLGVEALRLGLRADTIKAPSDEAGS